MSQSTRSKLNWGFGALIALLVIACLIVAQRTFVLERRLQEITAVAEPTNAAAYEMEISALRMSTAVLQYVELPRPELRQRVQQDERRFELFRDDYDRRAGTPETQRLSRRVEALYQRYQDTGRALMDAADRHEALALEVSRGFEQIDRAIDNVRERIATPNLEFHQKSTRLTNIDNAVGGIGTWLFNYRRTREPDLRARIETSDAAFRHELTNYLALHLDDQERHDIRHLGALYDTVFVQVTDLMAIEDQQWSDLQRYRELRAGLDATLGEGIKLLTYQGLEEAKASAYRAVRDTRWLIAVLLFGGVLLGLATAAVAAGSVIRAERALRDQRERLRITLESIGDGVLVTDEKARVRMMNPAGVQLTGWDEKEAQDQPVETVLRLLSEGAREEIDNPVRRVLHTRAVEALTQDTILIRKNGEERSVRESAAPIRDERGVVVGVVLVFRDVTEERRVAKALEESRAALERQASELRDSDRRKDEFLAVLGHELRNPLSSIGNALDLLKEKRLDAAGHRHAEEVIERQYRRIIRLVDDLLDVSRISRGKLELKKELVDLVALVHEAIEMVKHQMEARGLELATAMPRDPIAVDADPIRIVQVISNLLSNAAKYTPAGGRVDVSLERAGDRAIVKVRDTGIGIEPDTLPRVFEPFMQAHETLTASRGGLGIGLSLVRELIQMHGGSVEAVSQGRGMGSEFIVSLPASVDLTTRFHERRGSPVSRGLAQPAVPTKRRVLIVDDNVDAAESLALLVVTWGHEAEVAFDGETALEAAARYRPDVALVDLGLPQMNGFEVARAIRAMPGLEGVRLVAVTGFGQEEDRRRAREAGFDRHLTKPASPEQLRSLIAGEAWDAMPAPGERC
jgi:PAS domain S-box-containing protein